MATSKKRAIDKLAATASADNDPRVRALLKENNDLKTKLAQRETGVDVLVEAVTTVWDPPLDIKLSAPPKYKPGGTGSEVAVLHVSDVHLGKKTSSYDSGVCETRIQTLSEATRRITDIRRSQAKIDELVVLFGGDMLDGDLIFPGHAHQIDLYALEQLRRGVEIFSVMLAELLSHFQKVRVITVPGNHGRMASRKNPQYHKNNNWDTVLYWLIAQRLELDLRKKNSKRVDAVTWDLAHDRREQWYATCKIAGHGVLLIHGQQVRGGFAGFPWYGLGKKAGGWQQAISDLPGGWRYLFMGHFHTRMSLDWNKCKLLANGSVESDNEHAKEEMAACGDPVQRLCYFTEKRGLIADMPVYLGDV